MSKIQVNCPVCGTKMTIENANEVSARVLAFKRKTADEKIAALKDAGIDVSNLFSIKSSSGDETVGRLFDGKFVAVPDDDPIFMGIIQGGTIHNRQLFRRWVMAQVFHMMTQRDIRTNEKIGFTEALNKKGYKYQWKMAIEEFRVQARLFANDHENYIERNRWFNKGVAVDMGKDYINQLKKMVKNARIRKCKGVPYVRIHHRNVFVDDLQTKIYEPLEKSLSMIENARTPSTLHIAVNKFYCAIKKAYISNDFSQSKEFKDAYKGAGAFFTMKNLILFHKCKFPKMSKDSSIAHLNNLVIPVDFEGYKLFGVLKEFLKHNKIDIEKKQTEWRK